MTTDPITDLRPNLDVHTLDGQRIGMIEEVSGGTFKVSASLAPDFWLRRDDVQAFTIERVTMRFDRDRLDDHKVDGPTG